MGEAHSAQKKWHSEVLSIGRELGALEEPGRLGGWPADKRGSELDAGAGSTSLGHV